MAPLFESSKGRLGVELSDLVIARVVEAALSRPSCSFALLAREALWSGLACLLKSFLVELASLGAKVRHGRGHLPVDLLLLECEVLGEGALERVEAAKVSPRGAVDMLAQLSVAALEACRELGLSLVKDCVGGSDTGFELGLS